MNKRQKKKREKRDLKTGNVVISHEEKALKIKVNRTDNQHKKMLEQGQIQRKKIHDNIKKEIDEIIELISSYDSPSVLANVALVVLNNLSSESELNDAEKDRSHLEVALEYVQSLILAYPVINDLPLPKPEFYLFLTDKVQNLIKQSSVLYSLEFTEQKLERNEFLLRHDAVSNSLYIRGDGYEVHIKEVFLELFGHHDSAFESNFGFSSHHLIEIFDYIQYRIKYITNQWDSLQDQFQKWKNENPKEKLLEKYTKEELIKHGPIGIYQKETNFDPKLLNPLSPFKIDPYSQKFQSIGKALSIKYGDNTSFIGNTKFKADPLADTIIYEKPFVEFDGNYYCFNPFLGTRNYFTIAEELLKSIPKSYYNNQYLTDKKVGGRDRYVEDKVFKTFKNMFPDFNFYLGSEYTFKEDKLNLKCTKSEDGNYEVDIIGVNKDAILLIEVKAGSLSKKAKRGSVEKIITGLKSIIGNASCQAYRAEQYIVNTTTPTFKTDGKTYTIENKKKIYKLIISFEHLSTMSTRLNSLKVLNVIENKVDFPWAISLFDLLIFRDLISGKELLEYLDWRLPLYKKEHFQFFDEINLFGFWFSNSSTRIEENIDQIILDISFSKEIDAYFNSLSTSSPLPKPIKIL